MPFVILHNNHLIPVLQRKTGRFFGNLRLKTRSNILEHNFSVVPDEQYEQRLFLIFKTVKSLTMNINFHNKEFMENL